MLQPQGSTPVSNGFCTSNGCTTPSPSEYLTNDLDGIDNCNNDCIYKNTVQLLNEDSVDLLDTSTLVLPNGINCENVEQCVDSRNVIAQKSDIRPVEDSVDNHFGNSGISQCIESAFEVSSRNVISNQKTDMENDKDLPLVNVAKTLCDVNGFESICLRSPCDIPKVHSKGDINHNGDVRPDEIDSDTECTEPSESRSENTICDKLSKQDLLNSVETSTETLTSEKVICRYVPISLKVDL